MPAFDTTDPAMNPAPPTDPGDVMSDRIPPELLEEIKKRAFLNRPLAGGTIAPAPTGQMRSPVALALLQRARGLAAGPQEDLVARLSGVPDDRMGMPAGGGPTAPMAPGAAAEPSRMPGPFGLSPAEQRLAALQQRGYTPYAGHGVLGRLKQIGLGGLYGLAEGAQTGHGLEGFLGGAGGSAINPNVAQNLKFQNAVRQVGQQAAQERALRDQQIERGKTYAGLTGNIPPEWGGGKTLAGQTAEDKQDIAQQKLELENKKFDQANQKMLAQENRFTVRQGDKSLDRLVRIWQAGALTPEDRDELADRLGLETLRDPVKSADLTVKQDAQGYYHVINKKTSQAVDVTKTTGTPGAPGTAPGTGQALQGPQPGGNKKLTSQDATAIAIDVMRQRGRLSQDGTKMENPDYRAYADRYIQNTKNNLSALALATTAAARANMSVDDYLNQRAEQGFKKGRYMDPKTHPVVKAFSEWMLKNGKPDMDKVNAAVSTAQRLGSAVSAAQNMTAAEKQAYIKRIKDSFRKDNNGLEYDWFAD